MKNISYEVTAVALDDMFGGTVNSAFPVMRHGHIGPALRLLAKPATRQGRSQNAEFGRRRVSDGDSKASTNRAKDNMVSL